MYVGSIGDGQLANPSMASTLVQPLLELDGSFRFPSEFQLYEISTSSFLNLHPTFGFADGSLQNYVKANILHIDGKSTPTGRIF
jgi:hypothetical protein